MLILLTAASISSQKNKHREQIRRPNEITIYSYIINTLDYLLNDSFFPLILIWR